MIKDEGPRIPIKEVRKFISEKVMSASQGTASLIVNENDVATHNYALGNINGLVLVDNFLSEYEFELEKNEGLY